jgi:hypothetical protein
MITLLLVGDETIEPDGWWHARDPDDLMRLLRRRLGELEATPADSRDRDFLIGETRAIVAAVEAWADWAAGTHLLPGSYPPLYLLIS